LTGDGNDAAGGGVGSDNVYNRRAESVLVSFSDLYSVDKISVDDSRPSSCPAYIFY